MDWFRFWLKLNQLRYYPPEKQGLRPWCSPIQSIRFDSLRYYPPEKQGLRLLGGTQSRVFFRLRYYPPEKQGLRRPPAGEDLYYPCSQILSSRKTRIKTRLWSWCCCWSAGLRYYPPEKQGLRHHRIQSSGHNPLGSDTILQKNKD